jgi:hypothetical protein
VAVTPDPYFYPNSAPEVERLDDSPTPSIYALIRRSPELLARKRPAVSLSFISVGFDDVPFFPVIKLGNADTYTRNPRIDFHEHLRFIRLERINGAFA